MSVEVTTTDPMERIIEQALINAGIRYETDLGGGSPANLDFYLPVCDVHIEVKRLHSDRIAAQMARADNVIVAQGEAAVRFLAAAIRSIDTRGSDGKRTIRGTGSRSRGYAQCGHSRRRGRVSAPV